MRVDSIPLELIDPPVEDDRLERTEKAIEAIATSLTTQGLIHPIHVRPMGKRYECVSGWTRCLAARSIGWVTLASIVDAGDDERAMRRLRTAENLQRAQLTPIEEARAARGLLNAEGCSIDATARALHRTPAWIEGRLRLLTLPEDLQLAIHLDALPLVSAQVLSEITDAAHRIYLTHYAVRHGASQSVLRDWVNQWRAQLAIDATATAPRPDMAIPPSQIVVQVACFRCSTLHDHRNSTIARICPPCIEELTHEQQPTT